MAFDLRLGIRAFSPFRRARAPHAPANQQRGAPVPAFVIAFLLAGTFGLGHLLHPGSSIEPLRDDSLKYHSLAEGIERLVHEPALFGKLVGRAAPAAVRDSLGVDKWEFEHAPAYVIPLGLAYAALPNNANTGRMISLLFYAATGGLIILVGRFLLGRILPWVAFAGYLLYLPFAYYGLGIGTELESAFAILLAALLLMRLHRRPSTGRALAAGFGLGWLFLAKTTFRAIAIAILVVELVVLIRRGKRRATTRMAIGAIAPIAAWFGFIALIGAPLDPVLQSGEGPLWLYRGNYVPDQGWETVGLGDAIGPELQAAGLEVTKGLTSIPDESKHKRRMYTRAFQLTLERHPVGWALLVMKKAALFWETPLRKGYVSTWIGSWPIPWWLHRALIPLALLGIAASARRRWIFLLPAILAFGVMAVHATSHLVARYSAPVLMIWFLYALLGAKSIIVTARAIYRRSGPRGFLHLPYGWLAAAVLAFAAGCLLRHPPFGISSVAARALYGLGVVAQAAAPFALLPFLQAAVTTARAGKYATRSRLWIAPVLLGIGIIGSGLGDPDWDSFEQRLSRPGDAVVQRIAMPWAELARHGGIDSAWVEIDMLRSPRGNFRLDVLVDGETVKRLDGALGGKFETFLFDSTVHAAQDRYRRVADLYAGFIRDYVERRERGLGFDYFRRWVEIPVPLERVRADTIEVELVLRECREDGWVTVFGDRAGVPDRRVTGPAIGGNPFEYSSYKAEFFAGDRKRMDARLVRPVELHSPWSRSFLRSPGGLDRPLDHGPAGRQAELRIRLRAKLPGQMVMRPAAGGWRRVWTMSPAQGDVIPGPEDIRKLQWWRDDYFDGNWIF